MAVTPSQIRGFRRTLEDMVRAIGDDDKFRDFADTLSDASKALDEAADERGAAREDRGPRLGDRVKRADDNQSTDNATGNQSDDSTSNRMPPQFRR